MGSFSAGNISLPQMLQAATAVTSPAKPGGSEFPTFLFGSMLGWLSYLERRSAGVRRETYL